MLYEVITLGFLSLALLSLVACDKDFNTVGADLIGDGNYDFDKYQVQNLVAYTRATGPVQTNNMSVNALGVFEDPVFGITEADFVTQLDVITSYSIHYTKLYDIGFFSKFYQFSSTLSNLRNASG